MSDEETKGVIDQLRDAIRGSGVSLNELGRRAEVGSDQLARFMNGKRTLTLPTVDRLCRALRLGLAPLSEVSPEQSEPKKG